MSAWRRGRRGAEVKEVKSTNCQRGDKPRRPMVGQLARWGRAQRPTAEPAAHLLAPSSPSNVYGSIVPTLVCQPRVARPEALLKEKGFGCLTHLGRHAATDFRHVQSWAAQRSDDRRQVDGATSGQPPATALQSDVRIAPKKGTGNPGAGVQSSIPVVTGW